MQRGERNFKIWSNAQLERDSGSFAAEGDCSHCKARVGGITIKQRGMFAAEISFFSLQAVTDELNHSTGQRLDKGLRTRKQSGGVWSIIRRCTAAVIKWMNTHINTKRNRATMHQRWRIKDVIQWAQINVSLNTTITIQMFTVRHFIWWIHKSRKPVFQKTSWFAV